jgi:tyrosine-protein phosphatase YwqE
VFSFLKKSGSHPVALTTDVHSHLLAGIDDGVRSNEEALATIRVFQELGYRKLITTPHIMQDYYRNTPDIILEKLRELRNYLDLQKVFIDLQAAAEYYLDEALLERLDQNEKLLTFGKNYLLFETNMINEPYQLNDFIFKVTTLGYQPVMAHPERYAYMTMEKAEDLRNRGVLFQINILSIGGLYGKLIQKTAQQLIDNKWVNLLGSDCHHRDHALSIQAVQKTKYFQKALDLPLLNADI